jgi:hypothetical protein
LRTSTMRVSQALPCATSRRPRKVLAARGCGSPSSPSRACAHHAAATPPPPRRRLPMLRVLRPAHRSAAAGARPYLRRAVRRAQPQHARAGRRVRHPSMRRPFGQQRLVTAGRLRSARVARLLQRRYPHDRPRALPRARPRLARARASALLAALLPWAAPQPLVRRPTLPRAPMRQRPTSHARGTSATGRLLHSVTPSSASPLHRRPSSPSRARRASSTRPPRPSPPCSQRRCAQHLHAAAPTQLPTASNIHDTPLHAACVRTMSCVARVARMLGRCPAPIACTAHTHGQHTHTHKGCA